MGDIARHRDIYLNTRDAIPGALLDAASITRGDLTYLELGNYLTDVSQFRDPVWYILAKRTIWQERVLPATGLPAGLIRAGIAALGAAGAAILGKYSKAPYAAAVGSAGAVGAVLLSPDRLADILGIDEWIDRLLGVPIEGVGGRRRTDVEYGYMGQFFQAFIEGVTHLLFSIETKNATTGVWSQVQRIPESEVAEVYRRFYTQYYPHEHTDQPPYVWDASKRPQAPKWYGTSRRQSSLTNDGGIMAVVDDYYLPYLVDELSKLEAEWRRFRPEDKAARRIALVRLGKVLHGVEDWYFHSNVAELNRLAAHRPAKESSETEEAFVRHFVRDALGSEPTYATASAELRTRFRRRLYRRLRFPVYDPGTREASGGRPSKKPSTLSLKLAYPAFPSQQDTAHTLLGALDNLEAKVHGGTRSTDDILSNLPPGVGCALGKFIQLSDEGKALFRRMAEARGVPVPESFRDQSALQAFIAALDRRVMELIAVDVLREWVPLILTLLYKSERERLAANVPPLQWPLAQGARAPEQKKDAELDAQLERHVKALNPVRRADGTTESNYHHFVRLVRECEGISPRGRAALDRAFDIDAESEAAHSRTPGAGGVLMLFAVKLEAERAVNFAAIDRFDKAARIYDDVTDNGAQDEIVGSHSLMSKDTRDSSPFFDDARVMAAVASQAVLHLFLGEVSKPSDGTALDWLKVLRHLVRFPVTSLGWERRATAFYRQKGTIPAVKDLPEMEQMAKGARIPVSSLEALAKARAQRGTTAEALEEEYIRLERQVSDYRHP